MKPVRSLWLAVLAFGWCFASVPASFAAPGDAHVRVIHASPNAPAVDVYLNGVKVLSAISFFTVSNYLDSAPGPTHVQITPAGQPVASAVIDTTINLTANMGYSIAARGSLALITASVYNENLAPPAVGQGRVGAYHIVAGAPAVDIRVAGASAPIVDNLSYPNTVEVDIPTGLYNLEVTTADGSLVLQRLNGIEIESGRIYDVFAAGTLAALRFENRITDTAARVRIVHASPDSPAIDIYVDGAKFYADLKFFSVTPYVHIPAGAHAVQIVPAGQPLASAVYVAAPIWEARQAYSLVAYNQAATLNVTQFEENLDTPPAGNARLSIYHLSVGAPGVDVRVAGTNSILVDNLNFGQAAEADVPAGTYNLELTTADGTTILTRLDNVSLTAGQLYDLFASNIAPLLEIRNYAMKADDKLLFRVRLPLTIQAP